MRIRRAGTIVAVVALLTVAGCTQLLLEEETAFVAAEANVTDASEVGFAHNASERQNVSRSVTAAEQERAVTVSSQANVYFNRTADGSPGAMFVVVSSPTVRMAGQEMSPVADWSQRDLLTEFSGRFDQYGNVSDLEERETRQLTMVGREADVRVFNATIEDEAGTTQDVVVSVTKVEHRGDYVVAISIRGMNGEESVTSEAETDALVRRVEH